MNVLLSLLQKSTDYNQLLKAVEAKQAVAVSGLSQAPRSHVLAAAHEQSGGEVKRIEIATLLAKNSRLMIFDEPEAGIDLWSFARLTETFRELHEKGGRTILIISHQERIIRLADEIVLIANGEIAGRGTADELYPKLLSQTVAGCNLLEVNGIC